MPGDPRSIATSHFILLYSLITSAEPGQEQSQDAKPGKPVRSRAREAPGLMLATGPAGLLTFYASKAVKDTVNRLAANFNAARDIETLDDARKLANQLLTADEGLREELVKGGKGYTILLAMMIAYLSNQGFLDQPNYDNLLALIKKMTSQPGAEARVQEVLLPYLVHLKQLVESVVKENE